MADLPDISFTNNLGTISLRRGLVGVTDTMQWNGSSVRHVKSVTVEGYVNQGEDGFEAVLTDPANPARAYGGPGTLVLPWTTLTNVTIQGIDYPIGQWIGSKPVTLTFADEYPDRNRYALTLWGYTLNNPKLTLPVPGRTSRSQYAVLPWQFDAADGSAAYNVLRTFGSAASMEFGVSGSIEVPTGVLPEDLVRAIARRHNMGDDAPVNDPSLLTGAPEPFKLADAIPELATDLPLWGVIVTGSQVVLDVERGSAQVTLRLYCQPQQLPM